MKKRIILLLVITILLSVLNVFATEDEAAETILDLNFNKMNGTISSNELVIDEMERGGTKSLLNKIEGTFEFINNVRGNKATALKINSDAVFSLPDIKSGITTLTMRVYLKDEVEDHNSAFFFKLRDNANNDISQMMIFGGGQVPLQWKFKAGSGSGGNVLLKMNEWVYLKLVLDMTDPDSRKYRCYVGESIDNMEPYLEQRAGKMPTLQRFSILPRGRSLEIFVDHIVIKSSGLIHENDEIDQKLPPPVSNEREVYFEDILSHWARNEIEFMGQKNFVKGLSDKEFAPDRKITRAEFLTIFTRLLKLGEEDDLVNFIDIKKEDWHCGYIGGAIRGGLLNNFPIHNNMFYPNQNITREEMTLIINNAFILTNHKFDKAILSFNDNNRISTWALEGVENIVGAGLVNGFPDNEFKPNESSTRAQTAVILKRFLDYVNPKNRLLKTKFYDRITIQTDTPGSYFEKTGNWQKLVMPMDKGRGSYGLSTNDPMATATFKPNLSAAYNVNVQIYKLVEKPGENTHVPHIGNDTKVKYEISHNGKLSTVYVDFSQGEIGWYDIGVFDFAGRRDEYVKLIRVNDNPNIYTKTSLVRFELYNNDYTVFQAKKDNVKVLYGYTEFGDWGEFTPNVKMLEMFETGNPTIRIQTPKYGFIKDTKTRKTSTEGSSATWKPDKLDKGTYKIEVIRFVDRALGDSKVKYEIFHNGKIDKIFVNFKKGVNGAYDLGNYDFAGTGDEYVKLTRVSNDNSYTMADCVIFKAVEYEGSIVRGVTITTNKLPANASILKTSSMSLYEKSKVVKKLGYIEEGEWGKTGQPAGTVYGFQRYAKFNGGTAKWIPGITEAGKYLIHSYMHYKKGEGGNPNYEIVHNGKTTRVNPDLTIFDVKEEWSGSWINLGEYEFDGSSDEFVRFIAQVSGATSRRTDSMLFEKKVYDGAFIHWTMVSTHPILKAEIFDDTKGHRFENEIDWIIYNGFMKGKEKYIFGVDDKINTQEFIEIISKIIKNDKSKLPSLSGDLTRDKAIAIMFEAYKLSPKSKIVKNLSFVPFEKAYAKYDDKDTVTNKTAYEFANYFNLLRHISKDKLINKDLPINKAEVAMMCTEFMGNIINAMPPINEGEWEIAFEDDFMDDNINWEKWSNSFGSAPSHIISSRWPENAEISDGSVLLKHYIEKRNLHDYTVGHLISDYRQQGGYFEARYKYPHAYSTHSSFWDRGSGEDGLALEIDANEGVYPNSVGQHLAAGGPTKAHILTDFNLAHTYHTYAMSWEIGGDVVFYFDGVETARDKYIGGNAALRSWISGAMTIFDGPINPDFIDGSAMEVDWVKVYKRKK